MLHLGCTSDRIWNLHELIEYLSANQHKKISIAIFPEAIDIEFIGLYRLLDCFNFEQVDIFTDNPLERHDKYFIRLRTNQWFNKIQPTDPELHTWNQSKKADRGFVHTGRCVMNTD